MRIVNENFETITDFDLSLGYLIKIKGVKEDAEPIDNVQKFAWTDDDYEDVQMYVLNKEKTLDEKIEDLKQKLNSTDYKIIKCSEYQLLGFNLPYDIITLHLDRQRIRDEINSLELLKEDEANGI